MHYTKDCISTSRARHYLNNEIVLIDKIDNCYFHSTKPQAFNNIKNKISKPNSCHVAIRTNKLYTNGTEKVFVKGISLNVDTDTIEVLVSRLHGEQMILPVEFFSNEKETTNIFLPDECLHIGKTPIPQILHNSPLLKKQKKECINHSITNVFINNTLIVKI